MRPTSPTSSTHRERSGSALLGQPAAPRHAATLVEALARAAAEIPDQPFLHLLDGRNVPTTWTYGDVQRRASGVAARLVAAGTVPGDRVVLLLPNGEDFVFSFFGAQLAGAVPVPCSPPARAADAEDHLANLRPVIASAGAAAVITTEALAEAAASHYGDDGARPIHLAEALTSTEAIDLGQLPAPPTAETPALIQYTSGATSEPRGIVLSHGSVLANVDGIGRALELGPEDVGVSWLPLIHDMGLIGVLLNSLYWRFPVYVMRPESFLIRPVRWLEAMSTFGGTLTAAPNFAYQMCVKRVRDKQLATLDLSRLRIALNGAEAVDDSTLREFAERFGPAGFDERAFTPTYGLAENTLAATFQALDRRPAVEDVDPATLREGALATTVPAGTEGARRMVAVGTPIAGVDVAVVDASGEVVPERVVGEIVITASPSLMSGYHGEPDASAVKIRAGRLHTGDLGFVTGGELYIAGRLKEMIIKRGRNYYPADVESLAAKGAGLDAAAVIAFAAWNAATATEDLVLLAETPDHGDEEATADASRALNSELLASLGIRADLVEFVAPGALPRGEDGALARRACRGWWTERVTA